MENKRPGQDSDRKLRSFAIMLAAAALAVNLLVIGISGFTLYTDLINHQMMAEHQTADLAGSVGGSIAGVIERIDVALISVVEETTHSQNPALNTERYDKYFKSLEHSLPGLEGLLLFDAEGNLIAGPEGHARDLGNVAERRFFILARENPQYGLTISKPYTGREDQRLIILSRRFDRPGGRFGGVVACPLPLEKVLKIFASHKLGAGGTVSLTDAGLETIATHPEPKTTGETGNNSGILRQAAKPIKLDPEYGSFRAAVADGRETAVSYWKLPGHKLYVITSQPVDNFLADWLRQTVTVSVLCLLFAAASAISAVVFYRNKRKDLAGMAEMRNLTEHLEEMVAARTAEQKAILDNTFVGIALLKDRRFLWINKKMEEMFGYRMEELGGITTESFYTSHESFEQLGKEAYPALAKSGYYTTEYPMRRRDGSIFWCSISGQAIDRAALNLGTIWILQDITERRKSEEALKKLELAVENSPATVVITDMDGKIEYVNKKFTELTGYSGEEALGNNPSVLNAGVQPKEYFTELWETIKSGKEWKGEFCNKKKNGEIFWEQALISPMHGPNGEITHFVAVKDDITERKKTAEELKLAKEAAEAATRAKSEFLANMSHEIRTPLNAIIGMTALSLDMAVDKTQSSYLAMAKQASESLLVIINDILDFSKIEAGRLEIENIDFSLAETMKGVLDTFTLPAKSKNLALEMSISGALPRTLKGDPVRLRQILLNLLGNAVKFTNEGGINLEAAETMEENGQRVVLFTVRDTGVGIPREKLAAIFESFSQADTSTTRNYGGTGLGLTISMNLVHLLGGRIWVESEPGKGSAFHFTLPLVEGQTGGIKKNHPVEEPEAAGKLNILLVEDNKVNQILAMKLLDKMGHTVTIANNGLEALSILAGGKFDLVFMDVQMPEMDGLTAARRIRQGDGILDPRIKMIAMTANAMEGDREKCIEAGMDDYVSKPINVAELFAAIKRVLKV